MHRQASGPPSLLPGGHTECNVARADDPLAYPQTPRMTDSYSPPVDQLLTLGEPKSRERVWADYLAMGFTHEHVPELLRMMGDPVLNQADTASAEVWAPLHAWRTLGQLRAEAATEPLLKLLETERDDEWVLSEIPAVLGMIGRAVLGPVEAHLDHEDEWVRLSAMSSLVEVAQEHREAREEAVGILTRRLERWAEQDPLTNAALIGKLVDLGEVSAAPLMEAAFGAGAVELVWNGDWEDVQVELGLIPERTTPRLRYYSALPGPASPGGRSPSRAAGSHSKEKNRRKAEKASRKRNRRK